MDIMYSKSSIRQVQRTEGGAGPIKPGMVSNIIIYYTWVCSTINRPEMMCITICMLHFTMSISFGSAFINRIICSCTQKGKLEPGGCWLELFKHVGEGDPDCKTPLHITSLRKKQKSVILTQILTHNHVKSIFIYLHRDIQVDYEVLPRGGSEQEIEIPSCQPQWMFNVFGNQNVAVGWNRSPNPEHWALQCLVLPFKVKVK